MMGIIISIILWITGAPQPKTCETQQPTYAFRSTSQMMPATVSSREYAEPFSPYAPSMRRTRRDGGEGGGGGEDDWEGEDPGLPGGGNEPGKDSPIGDIPWVMMLLLAGGYVAYSTRKRHRSQMQ